MTNLAKPKILVSDTYDADGIKLLKESSLQVDYAPGLPLEELKNRISDAQGLIVRSATKVTQELLEHAKSMKVVIRAGVGFDNIDVEAARQKSVTVMIAPSGSTNAVAELTLGSILGLLRKINQADASLRAGKWEKSKLKGHELSEKKVGIIGFGRIGHRVAELLTPFHCPISAHRLRKPDPSIQKKTDVPIVSLDEILSQSDILTLHIPFTAATRHIIDAKALEKIKKGALLINCSRGGLVDEEEAVKALENGQLGGYAADCFEQEPPAADHPLFSQPNTLFSPHIGAQSVEGQKKIALEAATQMIDFFKEGKISHQVS